MTLNELQHLIVGWADEVLPNRRATGTLLKLFEEIGEIAANPTDASEYADVMIVLLDFAKMHGINGMQLEEAIKIKMEVNKNRAWKHNRMGVYHHGK